MRLSREMASVRGSVCENCAFPHEMSAKKYSEVSSVAKPIDFPPSRHFRPIPSFPGIFGEDFEPVSVF